MAIMVFGGTVLALGALLIVLPGPAFIVIPLGLTILGLEFAWAGRWLRKMQELWHAGRKAVQKHEIGGWRSLRPG